MPALLTLTLICLLVGYALAWRFNCLVLAPGTLLVLAATAYVAIGQGESTALTVVALAVNATAFQAGHLYAILFPSFIPVPARVLSGIERPNVWR